jgi:hypothetical protein
MSDYKKIAEKALKNAKKTLNEGVLYPENLSERMHPKLEEDLLNRKHSLGNHPIFPEGDEHTFEEKIMGERFREVVNRYKRAFDSDSIDNNSLMREMMPMVMETMKMESKHKKALEELAVKMIREEYDMGEDLVEIHAELTPKISLEGTKKNEKPIQVEMEFDDHDSMVNATGEVYKRRFLNAMIQGAAKKCNHMFHMVDDDLTDLDPKLTNKYAKVMAAADYMYYVIPQMDNGISGGVVKVELPKNENEKAIIHAQGMIFPVLIHELVKGVMEILSAHGLPTDKKLSEFVINKADFLKAEPWDMRLGPGIWGRFTDAMDSDDFNLKHHIYADLAALPVNEFNTKMKEIMANTKQGKKIVKEIANKVRQELNEDEFNEAIEEVEKSNAFNIDELFDDDDVDEGYDIDELF